MKKIKILMLEDLQTDAELNAMQLTSDGINFTYSVVKDEEGFVNALKKDRPDLILSDYSLPQFNGLEALEIIKREAPEIPFIMVTGSLDDETAVLCIKEGAWDYVIKEHIVRLGPAVKNAIQMKNQIQQKKAAEEALRQNEKKFREFTELLPEIVCETDLEGNLVFVNQKAFDVFGYTREDFEKKLNLFQMLVPEDLERAQNNIKALFKGDVMGSDEYNAVKKDGTIFPVMVHANVAYQDDLPIGLRAVLVDITERKKNEEIIRQNAEKLSLMIDNSPIGVTSTNLKGVFQTANQTYCNMLGYEQEELIGKHFAEFTHPDDIEPNNKKFAQLVKGKIDFFDFEKKYIRKDGNVIICHLRSQLVHDNDDKPLFQIAVVEDITERKQMIQKLKEREAFNYTLFQHNPIETIVVDTEGKVIQTNMAVTNSKVSPKIGDKMYVDYAADHSVDMYSVLQDCLRTKEIKYVPESKFGNNIRSIKIAPMNDGAIITGMDITARKKAEEKLLKSLKEKEVLLKEVHHRVKNNMQVISSMLKLQARHIENEEALQHIQDSQHRVRSMALIHEKLYQTDDFEQINFYDYVRSLSNYLMASYREISQKIKLTLDFEDIWFDISTSISCGLIINELFTNSLKYGFPDQRDGKISISVKRQKNDSIKIIIRDDGVGLPKGFDLNNLDSLGLQLVQTLTNQLHGEMSLENQDGVCFTMVFKEPENN